MRLKYRITLQYYLVIMSQVGLPLGRFTHKNSHSLTSKILLWSMRFERMTQAFASALSSIPHSPVCLCGHTASHAATLMLFSEKPLSQVWDFCVVLGLQTPVKGMAGALEGDLCHLATMESNLTFGKISLYCAQNLPLLNTHCCSHVWPFRSLKWVIKLFR